MLSSTNGVLRAAPVSGGTTRSLLWAIVLLAGALRLYGLADLPLDQDELYTLHDSQDFPRSVNYLRPSYYFLQHVLLTIGPPTPLFLRLPPFVFGVLGVWLTWALARRVFGTTAGLVAALLVAVSPWHLFASQFARYWTLVYALAAGVYLLLIWSRDTDRPGALLGTLAVVILGSLTHPTFAFPVAGALLALFFISSNGRLGWQWPSRRAWLFLLGPLGLIAVGGVVFLQLSDTISGMSGSRGLAASARLIPAMIQWLSPVLSAAAFVGILFHLFSGGRERQWGIVATGGCLTGVGLLVLASLGRSVFADYGMAMLPLIFVSVGGAIQRLSERVVPRSRGIALAATLVLLAGVLPGTVSHLSDGTRFDYRPAYRYVSQVGSNELVVGWPGTIQRHYAPELGFQLLRADSTSLSQLLGQRAGFWLVASFRRRGIVQGGRAVEKWMTRRCRRVLVTERPRVDYRRYRVELHWCGDGEPRPEGRATTDREIGPVVRAPERRVG